MVTRRVARSAILLLAPLFCAGAVAYTRAPAPPPVQTIDQPSSWVAFSADLERTNERGDLFSGHIYRASDGSTRFETGAGRPPTEMTLIGIQNIAQKASYHWDRRNGWTAGPIELPSQLWQPHAVRQSGYSDTDEKLEGFRLLKATGPTWASWSAPELNMYTVKREHYDCGSVGVTCYMKLLNIRLGEPSPALFQPPDQ